MDILNSYLRRLAFLRVKIDTFLLRIWTPLCSKTKNERRAKFKQLRYLVEKKYLRRYLSAADSAHPAKSDTRETPKIIWTCWWQGEENLPPVVKRCFESIRRYCPDFELRIITADNIQNYIELPDYIMQKHKQGYIQRAHLADITRLALLEKYGGIWMDATIYLTAPLPKIITEAPFFAYHGHELHQGQIWFFKTAPHNAIITGLKNLLLEYWKYENEVINYFFAYTLWDLLLENNTVCAQQWAQTPLMYDDCYDLETDFFEPYSPQKWAEIKAKTSVHKLSWKYKKQPPENSFLQYLLDGKLED